MRGLREGLQLATEVARKARQHSIKRDFRFYFFEN